MNTVTDAVTDAVADTVADAVADADAEPAGGLAAHYYDGEQSRPRAVTLRVAGGRIDLRGEGVAREFELDGTRVSEPLRHAPRLVTFRDGSYCEVAAADHAAFNRLLEATGFRDSWVVRWQRHWPQSIAALALVIAVLWLGYEIGLPRAADIAARRVPLSVETSIGQRAAEFFDRGMLQPSTLDPARRARLESLFASIVPAGGPRRYRLEFRSGGRIGANAFALPGGTVVMTDELVRLAGSDDALLGVMAHEIGHVERRHILRQMISGTVTAAAATLLVGDTSGLLAAVPATLADMSYSREMEREADTYAIGLLSANGVALEPFARLLEKLQAGRGNGGTAHRPEADAYLSSHPDTVERVRAIRAAESRGEAEVDDDSH